MFAEGLASRKSPQGVEKQPKLVDCETYNEFLNPWNLKMLRQTIHMIPKLGGTTLLLTNGCWVTHPLQNKTLQAAKSAARRKIEYTGSWNQLSFRFWGHQVHQARAVSFEVCSVPHWASAEPGAGSAQALSTSTNTFLRFVETLMETLRESEARWRLSISSLDRIDLLFYLWLSSGVHFWKTAA